MLLGELPLGLLLDLVVCLFSYLTADMNHSEMGMEMFQVSFNPEVLSVLHGSLPTTT